MVCNLMDSDASPVIMNSDPEPATMRTRKPILLVDDDTVDVMMVSRAFKEIGVNNALEVRSDGEEALDYLRHTDALPCLILLDLNMPRMNGLEFLAEIKSDETLKCLPVIVLSTSSEQGEIRECFKMSVAGYVVKPADYRMFLEYIKTLDSYWTMSEIAVV